MTSNAFRDVRNIDVKCSITLSRDTNDSRRSVLMRIGMRAYATKTTSFLICCNGCSLVIGDRNTIRTAVVFRLGLLASALSCVAVSGRREGRGGGEISSRINGAYSIMSRPCIHVRSHLYPGRQDAHICETRRYRRARSSLTSRAFRI